MKKNDPFKEAKRELLKSEMALLVSRYDLERIKERDRNDPFEKMRNAYRYKININNVIGKIRSDAKTRTIFCVYYGYVGYYNKRVTSKSKSFKDLAKNVQVEGYAITPVAAEVIFEKAWDDICEAYADFDTLIDGWTTE